ncbi:hypothetical protein [Rufibacter soli]|jgi:hypothetical protein
MSSSRKKQFLLLAVACTFTLVFSGCDLLWPDKEPHYTYKIKNDTTENLQVRLELDAAAVQLTGNPILESVISPGQSMTVWSRSGSTDEGMVFDFEKAKPRMSYFKSLFVTGTRQFSNPKTDFTASRNWQYRKEKSYEATYSLTITAADFN